MPTEMLALSLPLILFLLPLAWSPGPGNVTFAALGARVGLRGCVPALLGYHLATFVVTLGLGLDVGLGLGAEFENSLLTVDKERLAKATSALGAGIVLWLAWQMWHSGPVEAENRMDRRAAGMLEGAALLIVNPKAYAIIAAMFAQFLTPQAGAWTVLWITTLFTLNNLAAFLLWTWAGQRALNRCRAQGATERLSKSAAVLLAGVALWMFLR